MSPYDFVWDDATPMDTDGHGTHVAGTIGQLTDNGVGAAGIAFHVKLMPLKVIATEWDDNLRGTEWRHELMWSQERSVTPPIMVPT